MTSCRNKEACKERWIKEKRKCQCPNIKFCENYTLTSLKCSSRKPRESNETRSKREEKDDTETVGTSKAMTENAIKRLFY